ncbi:MAG: hypothetical protein CL624_04555 [Arcobacter sp.]|nr:hypothetical protein [Arcobacter sp.]
MTFDTQFMQNAITRINELQEEIIEKSKQIEGSEEYIQEKLKLYEEDEKLRHMARNIHIKEKRITENFFNK